MSTTTWRVSFLHLFVASKTHKFATFNLKGQFHEPFDFRFSTWIIFSQAPLGPFQIFSQIRREIHNPRCTTGVVDTAGKKKKKFNQKSFDYFF
jgi:hypothetical protein